MTAMTRRALARSATISAGPAIAVLLKTPLARSCTATLQHTRLGAVAYGRICPVHVWPVLRCPPRAVVLAPRPILRIALFARPTLKRLRRITELLVSHSNKHQFEGDKGIADELAEIVGEPAKKHVLVRVELCAACPQ